MGADKNSTQEFGLWTQFHSETSASFSCQVHVATRVLLDLGARHNQQPLETHNEKQHDLAAGNQNRSGRFLKPIRPTLWDLASQLAGETGQAGFWNRSDRLSGTASQLEGETGQTGLANRSCRFCPGTPQNTFETKTSPKRLKNLSSFEQEKP
jgi:hypothetical protein